MLIYSHVLTGTHVHTHVYTNIAKNKLRNKDGRNILEVFALLTSTVRYEQKTNSNEPTL